MSLERLQIKGNIFHPILVVGYLNLVLTLIVLIMSATVFGRPSGVQMEFPSVRNEAGNSGQGVTIAITGENVIYVNGRVVTLIELRRFLAQGDFSRDTLIIKADPKASMGRLSDILDLCRGISGASVNVSTIL